MWKFSLDVSFDDGEQDSNSEGANDEDETNDILDTFKGGEIELMFSQDYEKRNWKKARKQEYFYFAVCTLSTIIIRIWFWKNI